MTRTPDEIKKGLECASNCSENLNGCENCPYNGLDCCDLHPDALALIQQLEADNAQLNRCIENLTDKLNAMNDEVAKLQAERDAAVRDLTEMAQDTDESCEYCAMFRTPHCSLECRMKNKGFKWRGVQKEDAHEQ